MTFFFENKEKKTPFLNKLQMGYWYMLLHFKLLTLIYIKYKFSATITNQCLPKKYKEESSVRLEVTSGFEH